MSYTSDGYVTVNVIEEQLKQYESNALPNAPLKYAETVKKRDLKSTVDAFMQLSEQCHTEIDRKKLENACKLIKLHNFEKKPFPYINRSTEFPNSYPYEIAPDGHIFIRIKKIGEGDFKKIYLGIDYNNVRLVALAEIPKSKDGDSTFLHEQVALERLIGKRVSGLLDVYAVYQAQYQYRIIVSRFYCGGDLGMRIKKKIIHDKDRYIILFDLLRGLSFLHKHGIIHRDVKPENVLITSSLDERVVSVALTDFGSSIVLEPGKRLPNYMADLRHRPPEMEMCQSKEEKKRHSSNFSYDIWSLGVTAMRMYQGIGLKELPWEDFVLKKEYAYLGLLKSRAVDYVAGELNEAVATVIKSMLLAEPANRPSAEVLMERLTP